MEKIPLIVIAGPTASGKTALSISLAKKFNGEIVSADSMQIYHWMDIGTAKPTEQEKAGIPHHLMDFVDPRESFSVADYVGMAHNIIADTRSRGKLPIVVGGTGLYIDSLIRDVDFRRDDGNPALRRALLDKAAREGAQALFAELEEIDPVSAGRIPRQNIRRVARAIEFYQVTGMPISAHQAQTREKESRYTPLLFALRWDRQTLYRRIEARVDQMVNEGLFQEVERLWAMGCRKGMDSMQGIGYRQVLNYRAGLSTRVETIRLIKRDSRRYAKRQMTWFSRYPDMIWLDPEQDPQKQAEDIIKKIFFANL